MEKRAYKMCLLTQSLPCDMYTIDWVFYNSASHGAAVPTPSVLTSAPNYTCTLISQRTHRGCLSRCSPLC
jgi:hypothetical protein